MLTAPQVIIFIYQAPISLNLKNVLDIPEMRYGYGSEDRANGLPNSLPLCTSVARKCEHDALKMSPDRLSLNVLTFSEFGNWHK